MHDPLSLICYVRIPIPFMGKARKNYRGGYIEIAQIWHKDPCTDGSDDSCGRFMRCRHGNPGVVEEVVKDLLLDWARVYRTSDADHAEDEEEYGPHENKARYMGMFHPDGTPLMSTPGILINIYSSVLWTMERQRHPHNSSKWDRRKIDRWISKHLVSILRFAENTVDSAHQSITGIWRDKTKPYDAEYHCRSLVSIVYGDILRKSRPWWKHPDLHIHHWHVVFPWLRNLKRLLIERCNQCGKSLGWNKSVTSDWSGKVLTCHRCSGASCEKKH